MDGWIGLSGCGKWKWRVARFRISHMLSKFLREQRELPWQPNLGKIRQNWTDVGFVQDMETIFGYMVGLFRVGELKNMLRKILREPTPLLWQPNLGKNKPKLH